MKPRYLLARSAGDLAATDAEDLVQTLVRRANEVYRVVIKDPEKQSWRASIKTVLDVLLLAGLGDVMVLLEMSTLSSDARIDMLLVGSHPDTGELSAVAVENKQWSMLAFNPRTRRITHLGAGPEDSQHPVEQVWDYCRALERQVPMLKGALWGVANLHNASTTAVAKIMPPIGKLRPDVNAKRVRAFGDTTDRREFVRFLSTVLSAEGARDQARRIDRAHVRPSEEVMHAAYEAVRGRRVFPLLDEQRETVDKVLALVEEGFTANSKQIFIVTGGPGTGKTVLALELLGMLNGLRSSAAHASGSASFSATLRKYVTGRYGDISDMFTYFNQHRHREPNHLNVLICDEAHRLRKTSNLRFDKFDQRSDIPQIHELIQAARVPVFLLDPHQVVRNDEIGSPEEIRQAALALGIPGEHIHHIQLQRQFRHNYCPEYIDWLEDLLGYESAPRPWTYKGDFQLLRADTPQQMEDYLRAQVSLGYSARITAGYCWDWTHEYRGGRLVSDIRIDDWARPWNAFKGSKRYKVPDRTLWATDPRGFEQIGCIYTAQSFDWDYAGVIIGYDYTWASDHWKSVNNKHRPTWGTKRHQLVRNIYRVLASRGRHGVVLYSTDSSTRDLLAKLNVPPVQDALAALYEEHPEAAKLPPPLPVQDVLPW